MKPRDLTKASKQLSWLLRHGAAEAGVAMDPAGWAAISEVLRVLRMNRATFEEVVATNAKARFEVAGTQVRAVQGHSLAGAPVDLDALEASWARVAGAGSLWHGTRATVVYAIAREGIVPQARSHVHLAEATDSTVGKRADVDVLLEVSAARLAAQGLAVYRSPNGVLLVRRVPADCIVGVVAARPSLRAREPELRACFGL